jgi:hypothetical protein
MASIASAIQSGSRGDSVKARLLSLDNIDGRTRGAQTLHANIAAIESELGGGDHLAAGVRRIIGRAVLAGLMAEDISVRWLLGESIDPAVFTALANTELTLLESIGLKRQPRDVTPVVKGV